LPVPSFGDQAIVSHGVGKSALVGNSTPSHHI
jgi:hypothetical protein